MCTTTSIPAAELILKFDQHASYTLRILHNPYLHSTDFRILKFGIAKSVLTNIVPPADLSFSFFLPNKKHLLSLFLARARTHTEKKKEHFTQPILNQYEIVCICSATGTLSPDPLLRWHWRFAADQCTFALKFQKKGFKDSPGISADWTADQQGRGGGGFSGFFQFQVPGG